MKNKKQLDKNVDILLDAYRKGHLQHGDFCSCAVGNLITRHMGANVVRHPDVDRIMVFIDGQRRSMKEWFKTMRHEVKDESCDIETGYLGALEELEGEKMRESVGYSWEELYRLEKAFESRRKFEDRLDVRDGLIAAIKELCLIHEADKAETEGYIKPARRYVYLTK